MVSVENCRRKALEKTWTCNTALYEWWKGKMGGEVKVGGRYFSIMALCAYGLKCGIPEKQIRQDAYGFLERLDSLTEDEDNHFTREDVKDALKALKADNKLLSTMASREWIEKQTKVPIPPNKRNGRKQAQHLQLARGIRQIKGSMGEAVSGGGRPEKSKIVEEWRKHTQTAEKPTAREIQDLTRKQSVNGGNDGLTSVYIVCIIYT